MSILTSVFAALGSYYPEANPSLQGQTLFTKQNKEAVQNMDKQIYRLIGKAPTLAAMAYRVRQGRHFITPPPGLSYTGSYVARCIINISYLTRLQLPVSNGLLGSAGFPTQPGS